MPDYDYQAQEGLGKINLDYEIGNAAGGPPAIALPKLSARVNGYLGGFGIVLSPLVDLGEGLAEMVQRDLNRWAQ